MRATHELQTIAHHLRVSPGVAKAKPTETYGDLASETMCLLCEGVFVESGRKVYCDQLCKHMAYQRRYQADVGVFGVPATDPDVPLLEHLLRQQPCDDCKTFMTSIRPGGFWLHCDHPAVISDLKTEEA